MEIKHLHFISRLSCYTVKTTLIRITTVGLIGYLFLLLSINVVQIPIIHFPVSRYVKIIFAFILISEANVLLDNISERYFPFPQRIGLRIFLHLLVSAILVTTAYFYFEQILHEENLIQLPGVQVLLALGIIFNFILILASTSLRVVEQWLNSTDELTALKQAKLLSDYNSLQDQLNPHFLFNNLSVLKSMIIYDPKTAVTFTQNFTDVYRYVLKSKDKLTVKLKDEMSFIHAYISMHKERLGGNLHTDIRISDEAMGKNIPPLSLQLLVENAVKHNIASKDQPLTIEIYNQEDYLYVKNNFQPKETSYSTRNGLKNLIKRYEYLNKKEIEIISAANTFTVKVPLL